MKASGRFAAVVMLALLAACASTQAAPTTSPVASQRPPSGGPFPVRDTPLSGAPADLAALWRPYGVTRIPAKSVVDAAAAAAAAVPVANHSKGAFSDAQMQQFLLATVRDQLLVGWAGEHVQPSLDAYLAGEPFLVGADGHALADGTAVHYPTCALIWTSMTLLAPNPAYDTALIHHGWYVAPGSFPMRATFAGCGAVSGTTRAGATVTLDPASGPRTVVLDFVLRHDAVLGDLLFAEGISGCPVTLAVAEALCTA